ncbi:tRNA(Ile)-lysidine synthetase [Dissulfuribacter thermophilus]|uniref:tRNA(Ile)-lysidine synthase n=1 Tax=Dissulfuribacter thermophilus TaxID=1156395 RepID=A0A1B9F4I0_9BACT|nr:tRNA lysidine(34) synthetase TilS [Dissulfuribacter thermophilus]OCC14763.1 tRNA(Ile)-lysidine synthetase [Dissulfuribacter thermophilus]
MLKKVRETLYHIGIEKADSVVVACSGGPDSVALVLALDDLKEEFALSLYVAHFDHGLRGEESKRDALFVKDFSQKLGLPFFLGHGEVKSYSKAKGLSIQEGARELRYKFLRNLRDRLRASWIATAHTADDQVEEMVMRLLRGASLSGLSGIPLRTEDKIIRPLLGIEKHELLAFLKQKGQDFCIDSSNLSNKYLRNKVRNEVVPILKKLNPAITKTVSRTAKVLREDDEFLDHFAKKIFDKAVLSKENGAIILALNRLNNKPSSIKRRVFKLALRNLKPDIFKNLTLEHLESIDRLVSTQGSTKEIDLPAGVVAKKIYGKLYFYSKGIEKENIFADKFDTLEPKKIDGPGDIALSRTLGSLRIERSPKKFEYKYNSEKLFPKDLFLDASSVSFPLTIRTRQNGERFWPLGAPRPYKLKDFFISKKLPRHIRSMIPLIISGNEVVAVTGIEVSESHKVRQTTEEVLKLSWEPGPEIKKEFELLYQN